MGTYTGMLGVLAGLAVSIAFLQHRPLPLANTSFTSTVRTVIGNLGLLVMFEGIAAATPEKPLSVHALLRFVKYALVPIYIIHIAPAAFLHVGW